MNKALPAGTVLRGAVYTYTIEKVLGQGAFGITYLASTLIKGPLGDLSMSVAVKEFFAKDLDSRDKDGVVTARTDDGVAYRYAKAFQRESQNLSKMKHAGIVRVLEAFPANGTYYYSMEYLSGGSLDDKVKGEGIPEEEALPMIAKIGEALSFMHAQKMMHLDLKPKNIMLKADGTPVIIDFGLSKQYDDNGEPESSTTIGLGTPGYAPIEQATQTTVGEFQPTLDIYALGATLYKMLTGKTPPAATLVLNKKANLVPDLQAKNVSPGTIDAILKSMAPLMDDRPRCVEDFLSMLEWKSVEPLNETEDETEDETKPLPGHKSEPKPVIKPEPDPAVEKPKTWLWALLGGLAVLAVAVAFVLGGKGSDHLKRAVDEQSDKPVLADDLNGNTVNGHEWVDLGLPSGLKWATCNVGASSPDEYGDYFAWGETSPKSEYKWDNYLFRLSGNSGSNVTFSKYNTEGSHGTTDNKKRLDLMDDAASATWGGSWRMPTTAEQEELRTECIWTWTTLKGKNGYKVTSKTNGNSIFLPAAGERDGVKLYGNHTFGRYWSASLDSSNEAYSINFYLDTVYSYCDFRCYGYPVRPVTE